MEHVRFPLMKPEFLVYQVNFNTLLVRCHFLKMRGHSVEISIYILHFTLYKYSISRSIVDRKRCWKCRCVRRRCSSRIENAGRLWTRRRTSCSWNPPVWLLVSVSGPADRSDPPTLSTPSVRLLPPPFFPCPLSSFPPLLSLVPSHPWSPNSLFIIASFSSYSYPTLLYTLCAHTLCTPILKGVSPSFSPRDFSICCNSSRFNMQRCMRNMKDAAFAGDVWCAYRGLV